MFKRIGKVNGPKFLFLELKLYNLSRFSNLWSNFSFQKIDSRNILLFMIFLTFFFSENKQEKNHEFLQVILECGKNFALDLTVLDYIIFIKEQIVCQRKKKRCKLFASSYTYLYTSNKFFCFFTKEIMGQVGAGLELGWSLNFNNFQRSQVQTF